MMKSAFAALFVTATAAAPAAHAFDELQPHDYVLMTAVIATTALDFMQSLDIKNHHGPPGLAPGRGQWGDNNPVICAFFGCRPTDGQYVLYFASALLFQGALVAVSPDWLRDIEMSVSFGLETFTDIRNARLGLTAHF